MWLGHFVWLSLHQWGKARVPSVLQASLNRTRLTSRRHRLLGGGAAHFGIVRPCQVKADATWNQSGTEDIALQNIQARSRRFVSNRFATVTATLPFWEVGPRAQKLGICFLLSGMVMAYFMAQLMPWATDKAGVESKGEASGVLASESEAMKGEVGPGWGSLLVLGILAAVFLSRCGHRVQEGSLAQS